jgi:hypothetical protein
MHDGLEGTRKSRLAGVTSAPPCSKLQNPACVLLHPMSLPITPDADAIADCVLSTFASLPEKRQPRARGDGAREWVPLAGIVLAKGKNHVYQGSTVIVSSCSPTSQGHELSCVSLGCVHTLYLKRPKNLTSEQNWHEMPPSRVTTSHSNVPRYTH